MSGTYARTVTGTGLVTALCDNGDIATGGGYVANTPSVVWNYPNALAQPTGWIVDSPGTPVQAYVVCANVTP
ncbi:hypothetical protein [Streptomyces shenzhenensis]|uniref:hypothetical protein n=1 Tax=Streptomyces shenzhenensis TaxID=943815 RepID=UPI001C688AB6|nr:hypothetical protein [Streptomyces shenzhenensis]